MRTNTVRQSTSLMAAVAVLAVALTGTASAATTATTLNDLCPGTPDPCVVTGKFIVPRYVEFDAGGRQFVMKSGSSLTGLEAQVIGLGYRAKRTAPFGIKNAASIHLEEGAKLDSPVRPLGYLEYYMCQPRTGIVGATGSFTGWGNFAAFEAGGTHELIWYWTNDVLPAVAPTLTSWGLEICTSSGCTQHLSTDVPKTMTVLPHPLTADTYYGEVTSSLTLPPTADIVRVRVIDLAGTAPPFNAYERDGFSSTFRINGALLTQRGNYCTGEGSEDFEWSEIRDPTDFFGIALQSAGPCTLDGKVFANLMRNGTYPATIDVECDGVTIGPRAKIQARQGGQVLIDAGAGGVEVGDRAKIDVRGPSGFAGGDVAIRSPGGCDLGGNILASAPVRFFLEEASGGGGSIDVDCGSVTVREKAKLVSSLHGDAEGARLRIAATSGAVHLQEKALLSAPGVHGPTGGLSVVAKDRCIVDGRVLTRGAAAEPMTFVCEGFEVGPTGVLDGGLGFSEAAAVGGVSVDTTGATTGEPPADCLIGGKVQANGVFDGGEIRFDCGTALEVVSGGLVSANGLEFGGYVGLAGGTTLSVAAGATVSATGSGPRSESDGVIDLLAPGDVTIGGTVNADSQLDYDGGTVSVEGCNVTVTADARVSTNKGWQGRNTLTAHGTLQIDGRVSTTLDEGTNVLVYRNAVGIGNPSLIVPATIPAQNTGLSPCP